MQKSNLIIEAEIIQKQRNIAIIICAVLLILNLFLAIALFFSDKAVVLVPNSLGREGGLTSSKMSQQYIEALTRDVVNVMLNITPSNTEYASKEILKITHPIFYGQLKFDLQKRAEDVVKRKISTHFFAQAMTVSDDGLTVYVVGKLATYLGKENVADEEKTYAVTYDYHNFRPLIIDFHEVAPKSKEGGVSAKS